MPAGGAEVTGSAGRFQGVRRGDIQQVKSATKGLGYASTGKSCADSLQLDLEGMGEVVSDLYNLDSESCIRSLHYNNKTYLIIINFKGSVIIDQNH